ncbi:MULTISPECIES: UDP-4-amino-4,6-dideoxy-N-acetyl-beta-L-altrosamine transaminase [Pseudanabaena]|uniref:UDP-4-keto-6-deoxy-N-acetylglucosamine 4-aminotransferase n=2 Tax=Pseudanabaena TaxID=1152 RepID=L8N0V6_9CYAN|nr:MULTISPECIES: UDP-4-amino-4,6-dideoxy-N-acetyl-beta-L-altrosamine transaminase [Pseudanabaena]ELS33346.1 UDP-4-keto-6-deoxy-N-acetylglucosamine 4-aminotransferase [Pseudanabaena biceps PCC 7429]MDG3494443.1 UDP-4-amino-4,6-dideoxy-N-acetyl-beta-L-altrosamine transaminase [Pseudanabaena catenata USMAC16]
MSSYIPYGRQDINAADIQSVIEVLQSDWLTQGSAVNHFEQVVADYCGVKYAIAVSSATAALHIACLAIGLGEHDYLWTSPNTFVASANCGLYCGAKVDFVDIDPHTYNLSIEALEQKLANASKQGCLPKVLVPVHFAGQSCEMKKIAALSQQYGFHVLEDASHAIGGKYLGKAIGCCAFSDLAVFSFHPVKIITTGEGGIVLTNRVDLYEKLIKLRSHGITRNPELMQGESHGDWYYQQLELGFNYRMTDIQAALGSSQMQRLEEFVSRRRFLAQRYNYLLQNLPIILPYQHSDTDSSWHLYVIRLNLDKIQKTHRQVFEELRQLGIGVNLHYIPVHTQPYYQKLGFKWGDFPRSEGYYRNAISIPLYYGLSDQEQDLVITNLQKILH